MLRKVILLNCILICGVFTCQAGEVLDLTNEKVTYPMINWSSGVSLSSFAIQPLQITLNFEKKDYFVDEEFIYEITLKNISGKDFRIPWSIDGVKIVTDPMEPPPDFMNLGIRLHNEMSLNTNRKLTFGSCITLYGSSAAEASLKPDETVLIRAKERWSKDILDHYGTEENKIALEVHARAVFSDGLEWAKGSYNALALSEPVKIEVKIPLDEADKGTE